MNVIISAAGTGGHINPALVIANKIKERYPDSNIVFIGTERGLENDLVPRAGYELKHIEAYGIQKKINLTNIINLIKTYRSKKDVKKIFDEVKPDLVVGTGGYICGPVFSVATKRNIPTVLHESNAYPGRAVKMFAKKVDMILVGFEKTKEYLVGAKSVIYTGTPTKVKKVSIPYFKKREILEDIGVKNELPVLLAYGGSQGAQKINEALLDIALHESNKGFQIVWAAGPKQYDVIKQKLEENGKDIDYLKDIAIVPYIYNMEELMNCSDLLLCRSGAMTITEVSIVGKPAIFVPLPSRGANRQVDNARVLERLGAAKIILNNDLTEERLLKEIESVIYDKEKLEEMGQAATQIAPENVEEKIIIAIENMLINR